MRKGSIWGSIWGHWRANLPKPYILILGCDGCTRTGASLGRTQGLWTQCWLINIMFYRQIGDGFIVQLSIAKTKHSPFQANDNRGLISNSIGKDTLSPLSKSSSRCFRKLKRSRWRVDSAAPVFNFPLTVVVKSYSLIYCILLPLADTALCGPQTLGLHTMDTEA